MIWVAWRIDMRHVCDDDDDVKTCVYACVCMIVC